MGVGAVTGSLPKVVSAGGVVYRRGRHGIEIVVCGRRRDSLWALPKGSPHPGEELEGTATREVEEETGLSVAIEEPIGSIHYRFTAPDGTRYDKRVDHHLMVPTGGRLEDHDGEFDAVRWVALEEALSLLSYANERKIVRQAARLLKERETP